MRRALELTRKEAEQLGIIGEKPKRRSTPRLPKRTLREEEISAAWAHMTVNDRQRWFVMLTIPSPPRPKKNNMRVIRTAKGVSRLVQHPRYLQFASDVCAVVMQKRQLLRAPLSGKLHICARFYCDNDQSDLINLEQGLADALEKAGLVQDDHQFASWDGSSRETDRARPRVEITITPFSE